MSIGTTGPGAGDYNVPDLFGKTHSAISEIANRPSYSMGKGNRNVNIFSCKDQEKVLLGTESPAPTVYHPRYERVMTTNPRFSMG